jgi:hypothetical protein
METQFSFFDYHNAFNDTGIIVSYKGPVTANILSEISKEIRSVFSHDKVIKRKIVSIFIELAQNVSFYSVEFNRFGTNTDRVGTIVLFEENNKYVLTTGNLVPCEDVDELQKQCEVVNSLNHEELRSYKREQRDLPSNEKSRGAGIGIIQAALLSNNRLDVEIREINEEVSFFAISVCIEKIKKPDLDIEQPYIDEQSEPEAE